MFKELFIYLGSIDSALETAIWATILAIVLAFAFAIIYKILHADKIKAGPVKITDEPESAPAPAPELTPEKKGKKK